MKVIQCDRCKVIITKCKKTKILYKDAEPIVEDNEYTLVNNKVFELCENCFEEIVNNFMELKEWKLNRKNQEVTQDLKNV